MIIGGNLESPDGDRWRQAPLMFSVFPAGIFTCLVFNPLQLQSLQCMSAVLIFFFTSPDDITISHNINVSQTQFIMAEEHSAERDTRTHFSVNGHLGRFSFFSVCIMCPAFSPSLYLGLVS